MFVLGCDRAHLYAHPERELTTDEQRRYDEAIAERAGGVPAQYITGHQEFWGMDLIVSPAVLIPRPETEHVIETVLRLVPAAERSPPLRIVELARAQGASRWRLRRNCRKQRPTPPTSLPPHLKLLA